MAIVGFYRWLVVISVSPITPPAPLIKGGAREEESDRTSSPIPTPHPRWKHVLWVHIQGMGGYFISYRQLEQWVAACCTLIRACRDWKALKLVWFAIEQEADRYTEEAFSRLSEIHAQRLAYFHCHEPR